MDEPKPRNVVALFGEWNTTNLGDQLIGIKATHYYLQAGFSVKLFALGSLAFMGEVTDTVELKTKFFQQREDLSAQDEEWVSIVKPKKIKINAIIRKVYSIEQGFRFVRNQQRWESFKHQLADCCMLAVGGGDLLNGDHNPFLTPLHFITKFSKTHSIPLVCVGCSSSSTFSGIHKRVIKSFISQSSIVSVRDSATKKLLEDLVEKKISIFGDFAFQVSEKIEIKRTRDCLCIAINVMRVSKPDEDNYSNVMVGLLKGLFVRKDFKVVLFTTGNKQDYLAAVELQKTIGRSIEVVHPVGLKMLNNFFNEVDLVVASRLHASIIALNHHVPSVTLSTTPKITNFFSTIGLIDYSYDLNTGGEEALLQFIRDKYYFKILEECKNEEFLEERKKVMYSFISFKNNHSLSQIN